MWLCSETWLHLCAPHLARASPTQLEGCMMIGLWQSTGLIDSSLGLLKVGRAPTAFLTPLLRASSH